MADGDSTPKRFLGHQGRRRSAKNRDLPPWMIVRRRGSVSYYYYSTYAEDGKRKEVPLGPHLAKAMEEYRKIHPARSLRRQLYGRTTYHKLPHCESCGFVAEDLCQLDVDHKDGNHKNNNHRNLWTLCANCHRLKTKLSRDGVYSEAVVSKRRAAFLGRIYGDPDEPPPNPSAAPPTG